MKGLKTYAPSQDKNKNFLNRKIKECISFYKIPNFSYKNLVVKAKYVDVIWFNSRNMLDSFFEIDFSTNFLNSFIKLSELQDFYSSFYIVSSKKRKKEFKEKISYNTFRDIKNRVEFVNFDYIANLHAKLNELYLFNSTIK